MTKTAVNVDVDGIAEATRSLKLLDMRVRKRVVTKATRSGINLVRKKARILSPVDTGLLRKQLATTVNTNRVSGTVTGTLKAKRTKAARRKGVSHSGHYLHMVVGGTKPHVQKGKVGGKYYTEINHPGAKANPFLDRTYDQASRPAVKTFAEELNKGVIAETAKIRAMP